MQVLPILLVAAILLADSGLSPPGAPWFTGGAVLLVSLGPFLLLAAGVELAMRRAHARLLASGDTRWIRRAGRVPPVTRGLVLILHVAAVLCFGWVAAVRGVLGDIILLDELVIIAPALLTLVAMWASYYRIDRRTRESLLVRELDQGRPLFDVLTRPAYVLLQVRLNILLTLTPLLGIVAVSEAVQRIASRWWPNASVDAIDLASTVGALVVLLLAPRLIVGLQDVAPLPEGPLREQLEGACRRHRVRVRRLLMWNTGGLMINAAVLGFVRGLRYVLMTDALLQTMPLRQIEAVMAHEIGHIRRGHMPWMLAGLLAVISAAILAVDLAYAAASPDDLMTSDARQWIDLTLALIAAAAALMCFGWISRRFERQADVFAVQHLSGMSRGGSNADLRVEESAVETMAAALTSVAELNAIDANRWAWRHGSIAQRRRYLRSLVGQPLTKLAADRQVRWIKAASASWLLFLAAWAAAESLGWISPGMWSAPPTRMEVRAMDGTSSPFGWEDDA